MIYCAALGCYKLRWCELHGYCIKHHPPGHCQRDLSSVLEPHGKDHTDREVKESEIITLDISSKVPGFRG